MLSVIGVHAGKFVTERHTDRIAEACDRLGVAHPVVNDRQYRIWREYDVSAWPTVVVVDSEGDIALFAPGEFDLDSMAERIGELVERGEQHGTLVRGPDPYPASVPRHEGPLRFPARAAVFGGRLWIADTGHARVLECEWDRASGRATVAAEYGGFVEPRGLASVGGAVYAADRGGHSVWLLAEGEKHRVAGTGRIGERTILAGDATAADLRSPWGLATLGDTLAITMAGSHQLWGLAPSTGTLTRLAGLGAEALADGEPTRAALAQPTGAAPLPPGGASGGALAFADCESSAVRLYDPRDVRTLVGTGLFEFGDRDGVGDRALLQHCEDVAAVGADLVVADTYNDRLKRVASATRECTPWPGEAGETGALREPGGVWSDGDTLLVADSGHHRIASVGTDGALTEITLT